MSLPKTNLYELMTCCHWFTCLLSPKSTFKLFDLPIIVCRAMIQNRTGNWTCYPPSISILLLLSGPLTHYKINFNCIFKNLIPLQVTL